MASLAEALKDKRGFPDGQEISIGDGLKITLGELRQFQEATGQDVAKQLDAERQKIAAESQAVSQAQEEVVKLWTKLQEQAGKVVTKPEATGSDWQDDAFFAPIAKHLKSTYDPQLAKVNEQITQFQKALGLGVKYIADTFSEMRYQNLPEDFRKEVPYDQAVKLASEKKFFDNGGIPDIRKVHDEWSSPRQRKAEIEKVEKEAYERGQTAAMSNSLARPSGMPVSQVQNSDPNAPHTLRESFQKLKEDPEFQRMVYGLTGQA